MYLLPLLSSFLLVSFALTCASLDRRVSPTTLISRDTSIQRKDLHSSETWSLDTEWSATKSKAKLYNSQDPCYRLFPSQRRAACYQKSKSVNSRLKSYVSATTIQHYSYQDHEAEMTRSSLGYDFYMPMQPRSAAPQTLLSTHPRTTQEKDTSNGYLHCSVEMNASSACPRMVQCKRKKIAKKSNLVGMLSLKICTDLCWC